MQTSVNEVVNLRETPAIMKVLCKKKKEYIDGLLDQSLPGNLTSSKNYATQFGFTQAEQCRFAPTLRYNPYSISV